MPGPAAYVGPGLPRTGWRVSAGRTPSPACRRPCGRPGARAPGSRAARPRSPGSPGDLVVLGLALLVVAPGLGPGEGVREARGVVHSRRQSQALEPGGGRQSLGEEALVDEALAEDQPDVVIVADADVGLAVLDRGDDLVGQHELVGDAAYHRRRQPGIRHHARVFHQRRPVVHRPGVAGDVRLHLQPERADLERDGHRPAGALLAVAAELHRVDVEADPVVGPGRRRAGQHPAQDGGVVGHAAGKSGEVQVGVAGGAAL